MVCAANILMYMYNFRIFILFCWQTSALSFNFEEEDGEEAQAEDDADLTNSKKKRLGM